MSDLIEVSKQDIRNVLIAINNARFNNFSLEDLRLLNESCTRLSQILEGKTDEH